ncbi:MAG TPA: oligosaccharide flippase family protein [Vicinamibacterales bacterium]|nr:oligosaccharide flippase family protein [Vicinamibacterales bacterium]
MLRNVGSTWVLTLVGIAATYALTPFVIETFGKEGYGTWALITSMTGYISLLALGVPMACVRYLAQHVAEGDRGMMNRTIGSCAGLYLIIGGLAALIGAVLMALFGMYEIPAVFEMEAHVAFGLMVVQVSAGFIGLLPEGILFAHHDFVVRNAVRVAGVLLRFSLTIGLLTLNASLIALAAVQLLCLLFDFGVSWHLVRRRYPGVRISLADFDVAAVRKILSFSVYVLFLAAGARLAFETDALVLGAMLGVSVIPFYAVANSLIVYLMDFVIAIAAVVSPMATKLSTEGKLEELRGIFLTWSKVALSLSLAAVLFLVTLGPRFIGWWIDPSFEQPAGRVLQILSLSCLLFLPVRGVALPIMIGVGKPKAATVAFLASGLLNLALSILLARPLGLAGVALGTAIPNVLFAIYVLAITCRELHVPIGAYVTYVVPRATIGATPVLILLLWFKVGLQVETILGLAAAGAAMVVVFGLTWILYVYRGDPYVDLRPHLVRFRVGSRA